MPSAVENSYPRCADGDGSDLEHGGGGGGVHGAKIYNDPGITDDKNYSAGMHANVYLLQLHCVVSVPLCWHISLNAANIFK